MWSYVTLMYASGNYRAMADVPDPLSACRWCNTSGTAWEGVACKTMGSLSFLESYFASFEEGVSVKHCTDQAKLALAETQPHTWIMVA
jgi:hypothetical protein